MQESWQHVPLCDADVLQALESRRVVGRAAAHSPQAAAVQLYAAINAQSDVVRSQVSCIGT